MLSGRYVKTFDEATHAILDGVSLNARYPFYWLKVIEIKGRELVCSVYGETHRLKFRRTKSGDRSSIVMEDMFFGNIKFPVLPFRGEES